MLKPCTALEEQPKPDAQGVAVLGLAGDQFELFLEDLQTKAKVSLGERFFSSAVSPDFQKLAYIDTFRRKLIVINADGDQLQRLPALPGWDFAMQWLPDDNILLEKTRWGGAGEDKFNTSSAVVVNLTTHEQREYVPENYPLILSRIVQGFDPMWWGTNTVLAPSPDLTRIVYPTAREVRAVVLWDLEEQKEIVQVYDRNWASYPRWTRDGSHFVYSAPQE